MKLLIILILLLYINYQFFGVKINLNIIIVNINNPVWIIKSSSRDNSIIIIRVLIRIIVYDLDVELNIFICVAAYIFSLFDY